MSSKEGIGAASDSWGLLRAGPQVSGGLEIPTIPTDVSSVAGTVRLALGPNDEPRVLLPLADREAPPAIDGGRALSINISSFSLRGAELRYLDLVCLSSDLESVFEEVADEMLSRIAQGDGCVKAAQSTLEDFRSLLMPASEADVSKGKVAGLIAELLFLNRLLDRSPSAWEAWSGPAGDRCDFRVGHTSVEVKASVRLDASAVTINGLEQLAVSTDCTLHLLHFVLEPVSNGVLSISSLGRSALSKADKPMRVAELLAAVGCRDVDAAIWNRHHFQNESERLYEIRPGFPRLTSSMLKDGTAPLGVHRVTYQIDLSVAGPFLCEASVQDDLEARLSS